jgi:hypothetical protein
MAKKSNNQMESRINKNFLIKYKDANSTNYTLTTARKLSFCLLDDELKSRLFIKALESGEQILTIKIRQRLTIKFHSR